MKKDLAFLDLYDIRKDKSTFHRSWQEVAFLEESRKFKGYGEKELKF